MYLCRHDYTHVAPEFVSKVLRVLLKCSKRESLMRGIINMLLCSVFQRQVTHEGKCPLRGCLREFSLCSLKIKPC